MPSSRSARSARKPSWKDTLSRSSVRAFCLGLRHRQEDTLRSICVFAGSSAGRDRRFAEVASDLGAAIGARGWTLVYGGASVGLMGVVADAALARGAHVIGVLPDFLAGKEIAHEGLSEMHIVPSMHARKLAMAERADAFVALPGGFGTLEELFEVVTWAQPG